LTKVFCFFLFTKRSLFSINVKRENRSEFPAFFFVLWLQFPFCTRFCTRFRDFVSSIVPIPRGSLAAWWNSRQAETPALAETTLANLAAKLEALAAAGFKLAVIDTPPAITAAIRDVVKLADLVLIPTRPGPPIYPPAPSPSGH
jgi:hypothetical protein